MTQAKITVRPRRLRQHAGMRALVRETNLVVSDFVYPLFVCTGEGERREIGSLPGCYQLSVDNLAAEIDSLVALGIPAVMLFGLPAYKDAEGSSAWQADGIVQQAVRAIKSHHRDMLVIADLCFCEYTDHGHCGVVSKNTWGEPQVANDPTVANLVTQALSLAEVGVDVIAPSGMMDGTVGALRAGLDEAGFIDVAVMSYAVKYASQFYGAFRDAVDSTPAWGDRRGYQADPANAREALRECALDVAEGTDFLMVKPALSYLDVISSVKQNFPSLPLVAYQVSGEYAMVKAASAQGLCDEKLMALEMLTSIKRAGADIIISYYAKDVAKWLGR